MNKSIIEYDVLIPAYNAEKTISELILQIRSLQQPPQAIIVVDDGSEDKTAQICENHDVRLIRNIENRGKGDVLKVGFRVFLTDSSSDYLLCLDADLQHPVSSIPDFLTTVSDNHSKFVLGVRKDRLKSMPGHRVLSNLLTSQIISWFSGQQIQDSQCGFRMIHRDVLAAVHLRENGYQLESEMLLESAKAGFMIDCVPIPTIYNDEESHIANFSDTIRFTRLIFRELKGRLGWSTRNR
jgi:glycosyltransferase involved in cell wall biosynthesis